MNDESPPPPSSSSTPPPPSTESPVPDLSEALKNLMKKVLAGNPFYPVSAGLLLMGINRLSVDPNFLTAELPKLIFNLTSLHIYSALVVGVAVFLARRKVWYDATLLVVLEAMLALVPFLLVVQAILISNTVALTSCLAGTGLIVLRMVILKRGIPGLNLPGFMLMLGCILLIANLVLPFLHRPLLDGRMETWERMSDFLWYFALPFAQGLLLLVPASGDWKGNAPKKCWLPLLIYTLWIIGSAVHVRCVDYVSTMDFQWRSVGPLACLICWSVYGQLTRMLPQSLAKWKEDLLWVPLVSLVPAILDWHAGVFLTVTMLNFIGYATVFVVRQSRLARHLMITSAFSLLAGMPLEVGYEFLPRFARESWIQLAFLLYVVFLALGSRRLDLAVAGSVAAGIVPGLVSLQVPLHLCFQVGCLVFMVHGLIWRNDDRRHQRLLRIMAGIVWILHALLWSSLAGAGDRWFLFSEGILLILGYGLAWWITQQWRHWIYPVCGGALVLATPLTMAGRLISSSPDGLMALLFSYLLFAIGTFLAWKKSRTREQRE